jgi:iron(III) transport system ATP-binding protein
MAMSDRILLLNNGVIEQEGTPESMYAHPKTLFAAEFMGSNNRIEGTIAQVRDGAAQLAGDGWSLWGTLHGEPKSAGAKATGMIRLERVQLADGPGDNRVQLPCITSMYLGDKWEYLFSRGSLRIRAHGREPLAQGDHWLQLSPQDLWLF